MVGRYTQQRAYAHSCRYIGYGYWRIGWTYDKYYKGKRLRYPTEISRETDEEGARRFCKKHDINFPGVSRG